MQLSSNWWVIIMFLGAGIVAIGNSQYQLSREKEKKHEAAIQATNLLIPELQTDLYLVRRMQHLLERQSSELSIDSFSMTAWETVSKGDLLIELEPEKLAQILRAYHLINLVNHFHRLAYDSNMGFASALGGKVPEQNRQKIRAGLLEALRKAEPVLSSLVPLSPALKMQQEEFKREASGGVIVP